jgi:hypothetical protein
MMRQAAGAGWWGGDEFLDLTGKMSFFEGEERLLAQANHN